jgi:transposase InsO family protein
VKSDSKDGTGRRYTAGFSRCCAISAIRSCRVVARFDSGVYREDDRFEPSANHTGDPAVLQGRGGEAQALSAAPLCDPLYTRRYRTASSDRRGPRDTQRTRDAETTAAARHDFEERRYERLAGISAAQLYRLRQSRRYREQRVIYQPRPTTVPIGERRRPEPNGRLGYLRVDTVHQGDLEGAKGVYHIHAVDEITQWQVVGAVPLVSETYLIPVLEAMLKQFRFRIRGFHSDNGSEFINYTVAALLNKLLIEQTKSRPRHSNDNGLAETKYGAVAKHMGYSYIVAPHTAAIEAFYEEHFNRI